MAEDFSSIYSEITDEQLIQDFNQGKFGKVQLIPVMAYRSIRNPIIKKILLDYIIDNEKRTSNIKRGIPYSWLPVVYLIQQDDNSIKLELKACLKQWKMDEKIALLEYFKRYADYYEFLKDIID